MSDFLSDLHMLSDFIPHNNSNELITIIEIFLESCLPQLVKWQDSILLQNLTSKPRQPPIHKNSSLLTGKV